MPFNKTEKFDFIMSIGGNCAAASQCAHRGLRKFSLPFDYTFMSDTRPIEYFAEGIKDGFKNYFLKENLVPLAEKERGVQGEKWQYKDTYSGYNIIHALLGPVETPGVYESSKRIIDRRIKRLYQKLDEAHRILVICGTPFAYDKKIFYKVKQSFEELYPDKEFVFYVLMFDAKEYSEWDEDNICFVTSKRAINLYDFNNTNFEWSFLDLVKLNDKPFDKLKISFKLFARQFIIYLSWAKYR